jgi:membrane protease subunit HflC
MKKNNVSIAVGGILIVMFVCLLFFFQVRTTEVAVVTRFGKISRPIKEAGMKWRLPWPIENVFKFESRLQNFERKFETTLTSDGKMVLATIFVAWRISEPERFLEKFDGDVAKAENALENVVRNAKNGVIGRHVFSDFISPDPNKVKFEEMEKEMLAEIQKTALSVFGIDVQLCGIKQLGLPENVTADVFKRMKAERERLVKKYTAEGESRALEIRSEANLKKEELLAKAKGQAARIVGQADAVASESYRVFEKEPELAKFQFELRALENSLKEKSTIIADPNTPPFNLLRPAGSQRKTTTPSSR